MRAKICLTANFKAMAAAQSAATGRDAGLPGIVLVHGAPGYGKSCITKHLAIKTGGSFITSLPFWGTNAMLSAISKELGLKPTPHNAPMFDAIARELTERPRSIWLDESDCIVDRKELIETLRILHDLTAVPLVLIGMGEFYMKMMRRPQMERRILREVDFRPSTLDDSRLIAAELVELKIADDLVEAIHRRSRGSAGLFVKELAAVEGFCRRRGLNKIAAADYLVDDSTPPPIKRADLAAA